MIHDTIRREWRIYIKNSKVIEEINLGNYIAVSLRVGKIFAMVGFPVLYKWRIFFFPKGEDSPTHSFNYEFGGLGTTALGVLGPEGYVYLSKASPGMNYSEFKSEAIKYAKRKILKVASFEK